MRYTRTQKYFKIEKYVRYVNKRYCIFQFPYYRLHLNFRIVSVTNLAKKTEVRQEFYINPIKPNKLKPRPFNYEYFVVYLDFYYYIK